MTLREFAKHELFRHKCPVCGSLNKKLIPIEYKGVPYGYVIHCCNCGRVEEFIFPPKPVGGLYNGQFTCGGVKKQRCYAINECPHKNCPLWGTYHPDHDSGYWDEQGPGGKPLPDTETPDDSNKPIPGCSCGQSKCPNGLNCNCCEYNVHTLKAPGWNTSSLKNVIPTELKVNIEQEKFR